MEQFKSFRDRISKINLTDWQTKLIEEYIAIGDNPLYGGKHAGSDAEHAGSEYIAERMREIGLDSVELVPVKTDRFQFNDATLTTSDGSVVIKPYVTTSVGTYGDGITSEILDLGAGNVEDFEKQDVKGKIVLMTIVLDIVETCPMINESINEACRRGAAAVLISNDDKVLGEDTISAIPHYQYIEMPYATISRQQAQQIREHQGEWNLKIDSEYIPDGGITYEVVGKLQGESEDCIIYSGHLDHYFRCIQDNVSSVVTVLAIARMMKETGYRPKHTIYFILNGSHEIGHVNSDSTDFNGMYSLLKARPEIAEHALLNINFEYTAFKQHELAAVASPQIAGIYESFAKLMPEEYPGYERASAKVNPENFWAAAWCDAAVCAMKGIPIVQNDCMSDQFYTMDSPYMGRDHSQKDNWDIYSKDALWSNTFWFASLGVYFDRMPVIEYDFGHWMDTIDFEDEEKAFAKEAGLDLSEFEGALDKVRSTGGRLKEVIESYNRGDSDDDKAEELNGRLKDIVVLIGDLVDRVGATPIKIICPAYKFYAWNIALMMEAVECLEKKDIQGAREKLLNVDVTAVSYRFGEEAGDNIKKIINGERSTWTKGRSGVCMDLAYLMNRRPLFMKFGLYMQAKKTLKLLIAELEKTSRVLREAEHRMAELIAEFED